MMHPQCGRHTSTGERLLPMVKITDGHATWKEGGENFALVRKPELFFISDAEPRTFYRKYAPQHFLSLESKTNKAIPISQLQTTTFKLDRTEAAGLQFWSA